MRRKSERNKSKPSPERKIEKPKRERGSRRRRKSDSSSPDRISASEEMGLDSNNQAVVNDMGKDEIHSKEISEVDEDQVWTVKTAGTSSDSGEIQKLTICLSRPPSISDHSDKSPRAKKKLDRSSSQTDSPSESPDDMKKKRHKSKRNSVKDGHEESVQDCQQTVEISGEPVTSSQEIYNTNIADIVEVPLPDQPPPESQPEIDMTYKVTESDNNVEKSNEESKFDEPQTDQMQEQEFKQDLNIKSPDPESIVNKENVIPNDVDKLECHDQPTENRNDDDDSSSIPIIDDNEKNESNDTNEISAVDSTSKNDQVKSTEILEHANHIQDVSHTPEQERSLTPELKDKPPVTRQLSDSSNIAQKKRRWGKISKVTKVPIVNISTDSLKNLISDVQPVGLDDCLLDENSKKSSTKEKEKKHSKEKREHEHKKDEKLTRKDEEKGNSELINSMSHRKISITTNKDILPTHRPPSPPKYMSSSVLFITNLVRPFTLPQLRNLLQRTGKIVENGFWIDKIKSKCYVEYENEDQAVETRHALHGVTWPVSNPKTLNVDFSNRDALQGAMNSETVTVANKTNNTGSIEAWVKDQNVNPNNISVHKDEFDKPWDKRRTIVREWDVGKGEIIDEKVERDIEKHDRNMDRRKRRSAERSPEPAKKFKKKEDEAPAKLLDDLFRKTKTTPCIYWLPLTAEMIKVKEEQRRLHMAEHERRMAELRRSRQTHQHSTHHRR